MPHQTIAGPHQNIYACISGDGEFASFGKGNRFDIYRRNNAGTYDLLNALTNQSNSHNCEFSNDNSFLFLGTSDPKIFKYNGSNFIEHQTITMAIGLERNMIVFKQPYLVAAENNAGGDISIKFF